MSHISNCHLEIGCGAALPEPPGDTEKDPLSNANQPRRSVQRSEAEREAKNISFRRSFIYWTPSPASRLCKLSARRLTYSSIFLEI